MWPQVFPGVPAELQGDKRLEPDWDMQEFRSYVPCKGTPTMHWERKASCVSLANLFAYRCSEYTAEDIYDFYLMRKVVDVKRVKGKARCA